MRKSFLTCLLILIAAMTLKSEPAVIYGRVINGQGLTVRLMTFGDQVSYLRETLESQVIGEDEKFSISVAIDTVIYCWLDIEFQQADLFIQPGQTYEMEINLVQGAASASYFNRTGLVYTVIRDDDDRLNSSIQDFNQLYNDFLLNYAQKPGTSASRNAFNNFRTAIDLRFQNATHPFFLDYLKYKTASMELFLRIRGQETVGMEYISGQPVLYDHPEYMDFFHLYFEKYFLTGSKYFNYNKTYDLVNGVSSVYDILDSLQIDPVLNDPDVRELLLLDGLKELYQVSGFKRNRIIAMLTELSKNGNSPQSQSIACNLLTRLNRLQPGTPAPPFTLPEIATGKEYSLADFTGKPVYLAFFDSGNPACKTELRLIRDIYETYRDKMAFIAISVDKDRKALSDYISGAGLPWLVLHYEGNIDLLEQYDATTYPYFVLINEKGWIARCPAPNPSENLERLFHSF